MGKLPSEWDLIPGIKAFMNSGAEGQIILGEVPSSWGRPDILVADTDYPLARNLVPLNRSDLSVASLISRSGGLSRENLAERSGLTEESLSSMLDRLVSRGVVADREGTLITSTIPRLLGQIAAIEVKTHDWISGLRQAKRYRTFANEVYLFLGRRIRGMDYSPFKKHGIGLGIVENGPRIVIPPLDASGGNVEIARRLVEENILRALSRRKPS